MTDYFYQFKHSRAISSDARCSNSIHSTDFMLPWGARCAEKSHARLCKNAVIHLHPGTHFAIHSCAWTSSPDGLKSLSVVVEWCLQTRQVNWYKTLDGEKLRSRLDQKMLTASDAYVLKLLCFQKPPLQTVSHNIALTTASAFGGCTTCVGHAVIMKQRCYIGWEFFEKSSMDFSFCKKRRNTAIYYCMRFSVWSAHIQTLGRQLQVYGHRTTEWRVTKHISSQTGEGLPVNGRRYSN